MVSLTYEDISPLTSRDTLQWNLRTPAQNRRRGSLKGGRGGPWLGWVLYPSSFSLFLETWVIVTQQPGQEWQRNLQALPEKGVSSADSRADTLPGQLCTVTHGSWV